MLKQFDERAYSEQALAEREADILGKPQRVAALKEGELPPAAIEVVTRMRAAIGLSPAVKLPEYCLTMVRRPEFFRSHLEMSAAIFSGRIPAREREIVILRIAWLLRSPYEWGEHVDIAKRYGLIADEIARIANCGAEGWGQSDAAIVRAVDEMLTSQSVSDATWGELAGFWDEEALMDFAILVGQYVATALVLNTLRLRLEDGNPGLTHR